MLFIFYLSRNPTNFLLSSLMIRVAVISVCEVVATECNKIAKNVKRRPERAAILRWSSGIDCLINLRRVRYAITEESFRLWFSGLIAAH